MNFEKIGNRIAIIKQRPKKGQDTKKGKGKKKVDEIEIYLASPEDLLDHDITTVDKIGS